MSKKTLYLLGIILTILLGTYLYPKFCCNCCKEKPKVSTETKAVIASSNINFVPFILNGSGIDYHTNDNLKFLKNSSTIINPISDSVVIGIEKLKVTLLANPKQKVTITGYATSDEKNTSSFENLGLARANDIKTLFVSKGLPENQLAIKGEILEELKKDADTILGPAQYQFETLDTNMSDEWSVLKTKINSDPLILYFNTNKSSENLSVAEKQKVSDIVKYAKHVTDASILVIGHSDNVGKRDANIILGQKRAEFTKNYLSKNGIEATRIETQSKGPDEPISNNKANNRRTVITIK